MKPTLLASPLAWTLRKIRLKLGDLIGLMGLRAIEKVDFLSMAGGDFAHIIDVGVADGSPDLYARFPGAYLDLFEPHPDYHEHIATTVLAKRSGRLHPVALGREEGLATLFLKGRTGSSLVHDFGRGSVLVPVRRLDSMLKETDIARPSLLKIDTEGYELAVLRGAEGLFAALDCVVVEMHFSKPDQYDPNDVIEYLAARGFVMSEMLDFHVRDRRVVCADLVFRRSPPQSSSSRAPASTSARAAYAEQDALALDAT
jgi:FkbM family methyltransferase